MLSVTVSNKDGDVVPVEFDTNAAQIVDGALVVLDRSAQFAIAGFAPGQWLTFEIEQVRQ